MDRIDSWDAAKENKSKPTMIAPGHRLGLALSGGGFRATLFHLGVVRYLRDAGLLEQTSVICSVSGGSILAAHLVLHWQEYLTGDFDRTAAPILRFVQLGIRNRISRRYPLFFLQYLAKGMLPVPKADLSATEALRALYARWLFQESSLDSLRPGPEGRPTIYILATNLSTGRLCAFSHEGYYDGAEVHTTQVPNVALAVAASSAFTGYFPPIPVTPALLGLGAGDTLQPSTHFLTDGGVYDNLGVRAFQSMVPRSAVDRVLVSDASLKFQESINRRFQGPLRTALRSADILTRRIALLEQEHAQAVSQTDAVLQFTFVRLEDLVQESPSVGGAVTSFEEDSVLPRNVQIQLPYLRTDLDSFSDLEINSLAVQGYCVARQAVHVPPREDAIVLRPWVPKPRGSTGTLSVPTKTSLLRAGAIRRLRFFSWRDPVSYAYGLLVAVILTATLFGPSLVRELLAWRAYPQLRSDTAKLVEEQRRALDATLRGRVDEHGILGGPDRASLDTWSTAQSAYVFLRHLESSSAPKFPHARIYDAMHARLRPAPEYVARPGPEANSPQQRPDFIANDRGWSSRPGHPEERADPCLWMLAATAVGLRLERTDGADSANLKKLEDLLGVIQKLLPRYWNQDTGAWSTFTNQPKNLQGQAYSSTLAILALGEARRARLPLSVGGVSVDDAILRTAQWLVRDFVAEETPGWRAMGRSSENEITEAFTLQAYALLLQVEADFPGRFRIEGPLLQHLRHLVARVDHSGDDSIERLWILMAPQKIEEKSTMLLWKPWAIATLVGWMRRLDLEQSPWTERAAMLGSVKGTLERQRTYVARLPGDLTYRSSELLYSLTLLGEYIDHAPRAPNRGVSKPGA